jgi:predicted ATPase
MVELIPQLALIVGPLEAAPALAPEQASLRLGRVFPRFVDVFAAAGHPLVLFLDDLQWADAATLRMIELFMGAGEKTHMLIIGAYRDNEVDAIHPLIGLRDKLLAQGVPCPRWCWAR